jgi:hypothetical protein
LKCYARRLCVLRRTSKLAKKPAGAKEGRLKRTVTDVGNIYNVRPGGEHCCEVSLNFVFKSTAIHSLTSTSIHIRKPTTQLTFSNTRRIIRPVPKARQGLLDANPALDLLLQQIALIHEQDQRHLGQLRRGADRLPEDERVFEAVDVAIFD